MRHRVQCAAALAAALFTAISASAEDIAKVESQDLLFFAPDRPVVIRLLLEVDGQPSRDVWRSMTREMFVVADRDGDGVLSPEELKSPSENDAPMRNELLDLLASPGVLQADVDPPDGRMSLQEFAAFVESRKGGPFQSPANVSAVPTSANAMPRGQTSGSSEILFKALDRDGDGRISITELREGPQSLKSRDFDGDGASSIDELDHTRSPFGQARVEVAAASGVPVSVLSPQAVDRDILQLLLTTYRRGGADGLESLDLAQLGIPDDQQARYDEDGNGLLDRRELREFLTHPHAHVELKIRIGQRSPDVRPVEVIVPPTQPNITVRSSDIGMVSLVLGEVQLEISVSPQPRTAKTLTSTLLQRFKAADGDANGYLELKEAERFPVISESFSLFDRDADGKVFEPEFLAIMEGRILAGVSRVRMSPTNRGRDLLEILDTNRDRRLTAREFTEALERFDLWDANTDQKLGVEEVPQIYQLVFDRGLPDLPGLVNLTESAARASPESVGPAVTHSGPTWFLKMDQNGDGDVSRIEFLGRISQFDELDRDQNGLIDAIEAVAAAPQ